MPNNKKYNLVAENPQSTVVDGRAVHPTQKPEEMLRRIIIASSNKDDIVLDPFSGSGTTAVMANKLGRKYIGIEKEKKYITVAEHRLCSE